MNHLNRLPPLNGHKRLIRYAAQDWEPHQIKSGPRKGQSVFRNKTTGEIRDTAPSAKEGQTKIAGKPTKASAPDEQLKQSAKGREHVKSLLSRASEVPAAIREKATSWIKGKYDKLSERYGPTGAKAILASAILLTPIPLPGTSFLPIALAEAVKQLYSAFKGKTDAADSKTATATYAMPPALERKLNHTEIVHEATNLLHEMKAELGEEGVPDDEVIDEDAEEEELEESEGMPGADVLAAAIATAAEEGDHDTINALLRMSKDGDGFEGLLEDLEDGGEETVQYALDAKGHEHKGKGPDGGQFTTKGDTAEESKVDKKKTVFKPGRVPVKKMSEKARSAQASATRVDSEIQRYAEEHNEPRFAKAVGGLSFKDNEPVDVVVGEGGVIQHGIELKTMVSNKAGKITMKRSAMERKAKWEKDNKATFHTVVIDDHAVFNAKGSGKHDETKRKIFYRRGFGSFRVAGMYEVKNISELKKLLTTKNDELPDAAKRSGS